MFGKGIKRGAVGSLVFSLHFAPSLPYSFEGGRMSISFPGTSLGVLYRRNCSCQLARSARTAGNGHSTIGAAIARARRAAALVGLGSIRSRKSGRGRGTSATIAATKPFTQSPNSLAKAEANISCAVAACATSVA